MKILPLALFLSIVFAIPALALQEAPIEIPAAQINREEGAARLFHTNGNLKWEILFKTKSKRTLGGTMIVNKVPESRYFEKQVVRKLQVVEGSFRRGNPSDVSKRYSEDGRLMFEFSHASGRRSKSSEATFPVIKNGTYRQYHKNGSVDVEIAYRDGEADGLFSKYYESGLMEAQFEFKEGVAQGKSKVYYDDGPLWADGIYKNGALTGVFFVYNKKGTVIARHTYRYGLFIKQAFLMEDGAHVHTLDSVPSTGQLMDSIQSQYAMRQIKSKQDKRKELADKSKADLIELRTVLNELESAPASTG